MAEKGSNDPLRNFLKVILYQALKECDISRVAAGLRNDDVITKGELQDIQESQLEKANALFYGILDRDLCVSKLKSFSKVLKEDKTNECHTELAKKIDDFLLNLSEDASVPAAKRRKSAMQTTISEMEVGKMVDCTKDKLQLPTVVVKSLNSVYTCPVIENHWSLSQAKMDFVRLQLVKSLELKPTRKDAINETPSVILADTDRKDTDQKGKDEKEKIPDYLFSKDFAENLFLDAESIGRAFSSTHEVSENQRFKDSSINIQDILEYIPAHPPRKRILIEGEPGIGKSTLTKQLCYKFAAEGTFAKEFKLVIRVVLRGLPFESDAISVPDLVQSCTSDVYSALDEEDVSILSRYITDSKGKDTLFIMDGYDEFPEKLQRHSLVADIINGKALPASSFIITSRPRASAHLHDRIDRRIEVTGFEEKQIEEFTKGYFGESRKSEADTLLSKLETTLTQIKKICFIPLLLLMTCFVSNFLGTPPERITELFQYIIYSSVRCHYEKKGREVCVSSLEDVERLCPGFRKLCKLALDGINNDRIIFENIELTEDDHFGLLNTISRNSPFGVKKSHHFLHRTFQEFLAAHELVKHFSEEEQVKYWKGYLKLTYNTSGCTFEITDSKHETVFLFFCGLGGLENRALNDLLFGHLDSIREQPHEEAYSKSIHAISVVVAESRNDKLCQQLMSFYGHSLTIGNVNIRSELSAIAYLLSCSVGESVKMLEIKDDTDYIMPYLISQEITHLEVFKITLHFISQQSSNSGKLICCCDVVDMVEKTKRFICSQKSLKVLSLCFETTEAAYSPEGEQNGFDKMTVCLPEIISCLSGTLQIIELNLGNQFVVNHDEFYPRLACSLVTCHQLVSLNLSLFMSNTKLFVADHLAKILTKLPNLQLIALRICSNEWEAVSYIDSEKSHQIIESIRNHPSIIAVYIHNLELCELFVKACQGRSNMQRLAICPQDASNFRVKMLMKDCSKDVIPLKDESLGCIVNCMKSSSQSLEFLKLRGIGGGSQCCELFKCLTKSEIKEFKIEGFASWDDHLPVCVEQGIGQCRSLNSLVIEVCHPKLTSYILRGVIQNESLRHLKLACDFTGCDILRDFAEHLEISTLESIALVDCKGILLDEIILMIGSLRNNCTLKHLAIIMDSFSEHISSKDLPDVSEDGLVVLESALKKNKVLEALVVKQEDVNQKMAESILKGALANQNLKVLSLGLSPKKHLPKQELIDEVNQCNPKLKLMVNHYY